jgi:hypothetical protein
MSQSILDIVEESLLNIANRYKELSANPAVLETDLKGFDEQLSDIMDRYNKLKGLQSTYTAEELQIKLNEFETLYDDLVLKINNGFFKGVDGKDFTYDMFTAEQLALLKGADGKSLTYDDLTPEQKEQLKGADGKSLTYDDLTLEQKEELKGANGLSAYEVALNNGFVGSQTQWLDRLKGSSSSGGGSTLPLPIAITDVKDLQEWMTSYQNNVSSLQQSLNGGTIGSVNINELNGKFNSLNGNMESVMGALFGIQQEDDETGLLVTVQEGLFEKFEKLYNQVNPPVGG